MPCCAFAASIVAQLLFGARALKRMLLGGAPEGAAGNPAVEWRLGTVQAATPKGPAPGAWRQWSLRGFAAAALVEALILAGGIYGLVAHLDHRAAHPGHRHASSRGAAAAPDARPAHAPHQSASESGPRTAPGGES